MLVFELLNDISSSRIKPYDCVVESFACSLVPSYGCFALVRNSNGLHTRFRRIGIVKRSTVPLKKLLYASFDIADDCFWVMFTPSRMMRDLLVRTCSRIYDLEILVDE